MSDKDSTTKPELLLTVNLLDAESIGRAKEIIDAAVWGKTPKPEGIPINDLELTIRSSNCLRFENISTVEQLCSHSARELASLPNLGKKSLTEIKSVLESKGLSLKPDCIA